MAVKADSEYSKTRSRRYGLRDAAYQAISQGAGENYVSAFALFLQASALQIAVLSALPQLIGIGVQILSVKILHTFHNPRYLILLAGMGQMLCWIPMVVLPLIFTAHGPWWLILCFVVYLCFGSLAVPAWSGLLIGFVDPNSRGVYFARRFRISSLGGFLALGGAGAILNLAEQWQLHWAGFALVFAGTAVAKSLATRFQLLATRGIVEQTPQAVTGFRDFLLHKASPDLSYFFLFSGLMHLSVFVAGPFFVLYMLRDLHLSYLQYAGWMATGIIAQFLTLKSWGQVSDHYGNKVILRLTGLAVPFLPPLYLFSEAYPYLLIVNFLGGATWAGLSLGLQNYVFDSLKPDERTRGIALANAGNALGWCVGALFGGWLAMVVPTQISLFGFLVHASSNLPFIFAISGCMRLAVSLSLLGRFQEPRAIQNNPTPHPFIQALPWLKPLVSLVSCRTVRGVQ